MADHGLGHGEKPDFIEVKGTISFLKSDPEPWYRSCTNGDCKRKVRPSPMPFKCCNFMKRRPSECTH
jgi:hypothetical protein